MWVFDSVYVFSVVMVSTVTCLESYKNLRYVLYWPAITKAIRLNIHKIKRGSLAWSGRLIQVTSFTTIFHS